MTAPFLPLVKADEATQTVWARAAAEEPDKAREILDYVTAVPQFRKWSKGFEEATLGKSLGNIRAMHNPKHLAGRVNEIVFNDDSKSIDVCVKVLDPVDWVKVREGGYTGLSIGGGYLKKWQDGGYTRYTPVISEISLVDSPCIPSARFMELQKRDGSVAEVPLVGHARSFNELLAPPSFADLQKLSFGAFGEAAGGIARRGLGAVRRGAQAVDSYTDKLASHPLVGRVTDHPASRVASKAMKATKTVRETVATVGGIAGLAAGAYAVHQHRQRKPLAAPSYMQKAEDDLEKLSLGGLGAAARRFANQAGDAAGRYDSAARAGLRSARRGAQHLADQAGDAADHVGNTARAGLRTGMRMARQGALAGASAVGNAYRHAEDSAVERATNRGWMRQRGTFGVDGEGIYQRKLAANRKLLRAGLATTAGAAAAGAGYAASRHDSAQKIAPESGLHKADFQESEHPRDKGKFRSKGKHDLRQSQYTGAGAGFLGAVGGLGTLALTTHRGHPILPVAGALSGAALGGYAGHKLAELHGEGRKVSATRAAEAAQTASGVGSAAGILVGAPLIYAGITGKNPLGMLRQKQASGKVKRLRDQMIRERRTQPSINPHVRDMLDRHITQHDHLGMQPTGPVRDVSPLSYRIQRNAGAARMLARTKRLGRLALSLVHKQEGQDGLEKADAIDAALNARLEKGYGAVLAAAQPKLATPSDMTKRAEPLSSKEHDQRIAAAKARWLHEGHHDVDQGFDEHAKRAGKSFLGAKNKVAAVEEQRHRFWSGVADTQQAYDKVRKHLPKDHNLMMYIARHNTGLLYNPEEIGAYHRDDMNDDGGFKKPTHILNPEEADDLVAKLGNKSKHVEKSALPGLIDNITELLDADNVVHTVGHGRLFKVSEAA